MGLRTTGKRWQRTRKNMQAPEEESERTQANPRGTTSLQSAGYGQNRQSEPTENIANDINRLRRFFALNLANYHGM